MSGGVYWFISGSLQFLDNWSSCVFSQLPSVGWSTEAFFLAATLHPAAPAAASQRGGEGQRGRALSLTAQNADTQGHHQSLTAKEKSEARAT